MNDLTSPALEIENESAGRGETVVSAIVQILALATVGLGVVSGASWWLGRWQALAFGTTEVPMAPSTAFSFILLGASVFAGRRWPRAAGARIFRIGALSLVLVLSLLLGTPAVVGHDPVLERWIVGDLVTATGIPAGRMSPLTALAFLFASLALFCQWSASQWSASRRRPVWLTTSAVLSWSVFLISEVTLIGYFAGSAPVLGKSTIPLAALTAFAFLLVSSAILVPTLMHLRVLQIPAGTKAAGTTWQVVALASIGFVAAAALRIAIVGDDAGDILPYVTFYPAVLLIALFTGLAGGLLATVLAGVYVQAWLHGGILTGTEWLALTVFFVGSTITSLICEAARQSWARERRAGAQLRHALAEQEKAADALRQSEKRFRSVFQQAAVGVARLATDGTWLEVNDRLCAIVGYSREELLSKTFQDITHPDDLQADLDYVERLLKGEIATYSMEKRYYRKSGDIVWINLTVSLALHADGEPDYFIAVIEDISARKDAEQKLRLAASVFEHSFEGILITDADNRIVETNPAFRTITGYDQPGVLGKDPSILASGRHDAAFYRAMWNAIHHKGAWRGEIWNRRKDGEVYPELLSISAVRDGDGALQNYIAVFSDISQLKAHEAELDRMANYDQLTGLPNRRLLSDRLEQAIAGTQRSRKHTAVCYLDLDEFKPINDRYGHQVGDGVLVEIANRLRKVLRAQDTVARIGGDEFVLLLNDLARLEDSQVLLERVLAASFSPVIVNGVTHQVSASIGVTLSPPDVDSADRLLRHADEAMYRAKDAGRNRYHLYDAAQDQLIQDRRVQMQRIRMALTNQEFLLYYQPKVDMISREVIGLEALIRWQHPEDGLLPPGAFLPAVEGSDLELAVGEWVITAVLAQVGVWKRLGLTLPVSVNIGAGHLLAPSFAQRLEALLAEHPECEPGCLELEILETSALSDIERASQTLTACRAMGVRFALDDFGTGYSSLAYFRRLPIDELKIDQSFVRDMLDDPNDLEIVESVVRLAQAFNRVVVAEGVETPEHGALLTLSGCRFGQGYGIARPMPADAIPHWVSTWPAQGASMVVEDINKDDIPLVMAIENHRHWVSEFIDALQGADLSRLADIDGSTCSFERWYQGSGSHHYGRVEGFQKVGQMHARFHQLASAIAALAAQGEMDSARMRMSELFEARDELIGQLRALIGKKRAVGDADARS